MKDPLIIHKTFLEDCVNKPHDTLVYVPFQDTPNLPGFKINTIEINERTLYHGLSSQSKKKTQYIPIFTDLKEVQPSYAKYFELISLPIDKVASLITEDSSAQGFMLNMFALNNVPFIFLERDFVDMIKKSS